MSADGPVNGHALSPGDIPNHGVPWQRIAALPVADEDVIHPLDQDARLRSFATDTLLQLTDNGLFCFL